MASLMGRKEDFQNCNLSHRYKKQSYLSFPVGQNMPQQN